MQTVADASSRCRPAGLPTDFDRLVQAVQTNCHIADAEQATEASLCIYLLQMREFFRWERGLPPLQSLPRDELGAWLSARESLWAELEGSPFRTLPLAGAELDPFDTAEINAALRPHGLAYGAGRTAPGHASFFLAELCSVEHRDEVEVLVCGCEHARNLQAPPAVLAAGTVMVRRESLQRWLGEKFEAWSLKRQDGPFVAALRAHGFEGGDAGLALQRMADAETEALVLHELGEHAAGQLLGRPWHALRASAPTRRAELHLRALRDHLADCIVTLPTLLDTRADASIHFWFANLEGIRGALFPRASMAYAQWRAGDGGRELRRCAADGAAHWHAIGSRLCAMEREGAAPEAVEALLYADSTRL